MSTYVVCVLGKCERKQLNARCSESDTNHALKKFQCIYVALSLLPAMHLISGENCFPPIRQGGWGIQCRMYLDVSAFESRLNVCYETNIQFTRR